MTTPIYGTYDYFLHIARCGVVRYIGENYDERDHALAAIMHEAHQKGENSGLWHACAIYWNRLDSCQCYPCCEKRKKENK